MLREAAGFHYRSQLSANRPLGVWSGFAASATPLRLYFFSASSA